MTPFIGPAWGRDGQPFLVESLVGKRGQRRQRHMQRTRAIVDDFGNAVAYERRCSSCASWWPLGLTTFFVDESGSTLGFGYTCHPCNRNAQAARFRRNRDRILARRRVRYRERLDEDPALLAKLRVDWAEQERAQRERDPEGFRQRMNAASERYRQRLYGDPAYAERLQRHRENQRIYSRLKREQEGVPLDSLRRYGQGEAEEAKGRNTPRVPCKPLAAVVRAHSATDDIEGVCERAGVSSKTVRRWWLEEDGPNATLPAADLVLTRLGETWWEVFSPERFPGLYTAERWVEVVAEAAQVFDGEALIAA